ncbi:MAG: hypothetical protein IJ060_05035 [Oscillospiraceae bacterium]|nr:hypothetical protein [Oscillospiraceae bacterium]
MKKILFAVITGIACVFLFPSINRQKAHATDTYPNFSISVTEIGVGVKIGNPATTGYLVQDDGYEYYAVSLSIHNNVGYTGSGFQLIYNADCYTPVVQEGTERPVYCKGDAASGLVASTSVNFPNHIIALSTSGTNSSGDVTDDGVIYTVVLRKRTDATGTNFNEFITNFNVCKFIHSDFSPVFSTAGSADYPIPLYSHTFNIYYLLGDLDGNGAVEIDDVQILLAMLDRLNNQNIPANTYEEAVEVLAQEQYTVDGFYGIDHEGALWFVMEAADADHDGIPTTDDAQELLDYYTYKVTHPNYVDTVNHIGTQQTYTYTYIDTNP